MRDFKKEIKILSRRNGFWIILVLAVSLLFSGLFQTKSLDESYRSLIQTTNTLNKMAKTGKKYDKYTKIDKKFFQDNDVIFEKMSKKYKYEENINFDYEKASQKEIDEREEFQLKYGEYISTLDQYKYLSHEAKGKSNNFYFSYISVMGIVVAIVLGVLFSSMEHATSYYEFAKTYPWTKKKDFLMKIGFGLMIILGFVFLSSALNYMILKTSNFEILKTGTRQIPETIKSFGMISAIYLAILSAGFMAGNILGHFGLSVMTFGFLDILDGIIGNMSEILFGYSDYNRTFVSLIEKNIPNNGSLINTIFRVILRPLTNFDSTKYGVIGLIIFSLIVFSISFSLIEKTKTENSGKMVLLKPIESLAKILVIMLFSSIGTMIFQSSIFEGFSIMNFVVLAILIFVFTKIFNILFKLKLKV
ncbi:ABC transporter permease [Anaerococcus rubeinfantis]|uniref:ABC transporter permease n=1 Tax=Anaerococcus rubeinfantis TaxID=1720199 RepID=UPI00073F8593|nr:ABC transporter permease [Anaerococcus rubeinfantis]